MKKSLAVGLVFSLVLAVAGLFTACGKDNAADEKAKTTDGGENPQVVLSIYSDFDTTYYVGQTLNISGGILNYTKDGKTNKVAITEEMISGFSTDTAGNRNMIVTYQDEQLLINYTVKEIPTKSNVSTSKVYKSQTVSIDGRNVISYIRFDYVGNTLRFKLVNAASSEESSKYAYNAAIWNEPVGQNGISYEGTLSTGFDINTEKWTFLHTEMTGSMTTVCLFNNVTEDTFEFVLNQTDVSSARVFDLNVNMTKIV